MPFDVEGVQAPPFERCDYRSAVSWIDSVAGLSKVAIDTKALLNHLKREQINVEHLSSRDTTHGRGVQHLSDVQVF